MNGWLNISKTWCSTGEAGLKVSYNEDTLDVEMGMRKAETIGVKANTVYERYGL